ncbi:CorA metal ion transporter [Coemansia asiatica]|uniref:CorA metal ion transporter n=1 Tax=Coemansia asiatica TaxID=1052880 RepID=A0A9W7XFY7_9FUNG|nr:CorA metal ion transporter [Coemansia asiatica]KAJ2888174.1 CorA metal ion transporter [Coemansia asiatica]
MNQAKDTAVSAASMQHSLEQLLEATNRSKHSDAQKLARLLLSDFTALKTHSAIASAYSENSSNDNSGSIASEHTWTGDWNADALDELALNGIVAGAMDDVAAESPSMSFVSTKTSQPVDNDNSRFMLFLSSAGVQQPANIDDALAALAERTGGCSWLDINEPTEPELQRMARTLHIHPLTVEDMVAGINTTQHQQQQQQQPDKLERTSWASGHGFVFVTYGALDQTTSRLQTSSMLSILVFATCVVTVHGQQLVPHVQAALVRLLGERNEPTAPFIAYALIDSITDNLEYLARSIEKDVQAVDALVMQADGSKAEMLQRIGAARRNLLGLWRALAAKPDVIRQLMRLVVEHDDMWHQLGDVHDHLGSLTFLCGQCEMVLARAHANYMAQLSLGLSRTTVGVGVFSNQWAVLACVLLPLQIAAGLFGQNIKVPWMVDVETGTNNNLHAWFGIFGFMMLFLLCVVGVLRRCGAL